MHLGLDKHYGVLYTKSMGRTMTKGRPVPFTEYNSTMVSLCLALVICLSSCGKPYVKVYERLEGNTLPKLGAELGLIFE